MLYEVITSSGSADARPISAVIVRVENGGVMEGYRFTIPYIVRVADVNYGGHVSNAAVLSFFQDARIAYLGHLGP